MTAPRRGPWMCVFAVLCALPLSGCADLVVRDVSSLLAPRLMRSEIVGIVAGFGTTFAALPDLAAMLRRRSSAGMNPRMAAITGAFQIAWVYYGFLILSRPVIVWNALGVLINLFSVSAFFYFARRERDDSPSAALPSSTVASSE